MTVEKDKIRLLLAEDDAMNRKTFLRMLKPLGLEIDVAVNGEETVQKVKETDYDFIFMDYLMPVMDGAEATKQIRKMGLKYRSLPIVALTGSIDDLDVLLDAGMSDYLTKPTTFEKACRMLDEWLPKSALNK